MDVEGKIGVKKWQRLPKKIVVSKRLSLPRPEDDKRTPYEMVVTMWIMDAPYSTHQPCISLTFAHGKGLKRQYFRIVFPSVEDLQCWLIDLSIFILDKKDEIEKVLKEAIEEWKLAWEKIMEAKREGKTISQGEIACQNANISKPEVIKSEVSDGKDSTSG